MRVALAFACNENWEGMDGDEQERRCALCVCKVYNLSALGLQKARSLMASHAAGDEVCVRFERNGDGSVRFAQATMAALAVGGLTLAAPALADGLIPELSEGPVVEAQIGDVLVDVDDTDCVTGQQGGLTVQPGTVDPVPPVKPRPLMGRPMRPPQPPPPPPPTPTPTPTDGGT